MFETVQANAMPLVVFLAFICNSPMRQCLTLAFPLEAARSASLQCNALLEISHGSFKQGRQRPQEREFQYPIRRIEFQSESFRRSRTE